MAGGYTKLFSSILDSTVWQEPGDTRLTWITMLAMADQHGVVSSSIPGLAKRAGVPIEGCERALETFLAPDRYSRTKDNAGRRIEPIQGGWVLLNHAHYRELREREDRREQARLGMAALRERRKGEPVNDVNSLTNVGIVGEASASTASLKSKALRTVPARCVDRFEEFWLAYPLKKGKVSAIKAWKRDKLDVIADKIIADVKARISGDEDWKRGAIPYGSTYVNQQRWEDALTVEAVASDRKVAGNSPAVVDTPEDRKRKHLENDAALQKLMKETGYGD